MSAARGRAIVIGGGIIGTACAHYLSASGWRVEVVERGEFGMGCSHANCGFVCPSHVLPLAGPGAIRSTLRAMLRPNSPFAIKPRFDPALWGWLLNFARRCNAPDMMESARAIQALLHSSRALYDELIQQERLDCEWEARGLLYVLQSRRGMEHFEETAQLLRESFNLPAQRYDGDALLEVEPALKPGLAGGWLYRTDAHLRPDRLLSSWRRLLESQGVVVREHCEVKGFVRERGRARAVVTPQGELPADAFVVATGAWTPFMNRHLGCKVPIQPGKGYSITMRRPAKCPSLPLLFEEHRVAVTPMKSGYRLGSTMEFAGYDATLDRRRLALLREGASHYLQEPYGEPVEEEWFGWRPMTYDSKPIIDRSPALPNVLIAAGHNMLGLSMAPATGKLVAELLSGVVPHLDPTPYAVSRFG
ncbi:MAG TPA: FAD-dependent oxidoreductase [Gemmataceae bacterium]|nr:FAD-dependent oxidoreductase [Gemmataceae bacterium]